MQLQAETLEKWWLLAKFTGEKNVQIEIWLKALLFNEEWFGRDLISTSALQENSQWVVNELEIITIITMSSKQPLEIVHAATN